MTLEAVAEMTSQVTGIGKASVCRKKQEVNNNNTLSSPNKFRRRTFLSEKFDDFTLSTIRVKVHELLLFFRNELLTMNKFLAAINSDADFPCFSRTTLHRLLMVLKFKYVSRNRDVFYLTETILYCDAENASEWLSHSEPKEGQCITWTRHGSVQVTPFKTF
jgi:hypothetical protein